MRPVQVDIQHEHHPRVLELTTTWECSRIRGCDVESHCHSSMDFHPAPDCAATCTKRDESLEVVLKTGASAILNIGGNSPMVLYLICISLFNVDYSVFCIFKRVRDRWSSEVVRSHAIRTTTALYRLSPTADSASKLKCGTAQGWKLTLCILASPDDRRTGEAVVMEWTSPPKGRWQAQSTVPVSRH